MRRSEAFDILARVWDEYWSARFCVKEVLRRLPSDPLLLAAETATGLTHARIQRCAANLEVTYVIRLFSEFEAILQEYWEQGLGRSTRPKIRVLIDRIAAARGMALDHSAEAHDVRGYRNEIVHEGLRTTRLSFRQCKTSLGRFASWLPDQW